MNTVSRHLDSDQLIARWLDFPSNAPDYTANESR